MSWVSPYLKPVLLVLTQEISNLLIVDLQVRHSHQESDDKQVDDNKVMNKTHVW